MEGWLVVVVAALMVGLVVLGVVAARRRRARIVAWAAANGWQFRASDPALARRWRGAPFGVGNSRRATEVLTGAWSGSPATAFRYQYTTTNGKQTTTHTFEVVVLGLPAFLPTLELTPEGLGAKLAKAVGGQDLEFESEDFNRAWRVTCRMPKFASDVVHPRLMERLLRPGARANLRIDGTEILTWRAGALDLDGLAGRLGLLEGVAESIPRFVWQDHGYDPITSTSPEGEK